MRRRTRKSVRWHEEALDAEFRAPENTGPLPHAPASKRAWTPDPGLSPIFYTPKTAGRFFTPFRAAFLFSTLLHLSMVTLFNIVIYFPRQDISFFNVEIVQIRPGALINAAETPPVRTTRLSDPLRQGLDFNGQAALEMLTSSIELPTLEFAELNRLRVRQETLDFPAGYEDIFDEGPRDSWAQFGAGIKRLRQTLTDLAFPSSESSGRPDPPAGIFHPAQGFDAYIEWSSEPQNRALLFAPPVDALWEIDPTALKRPLELVLKVDAYGRVVNVWSPSVDNGGIVDQVQMTILKYRFEPLDTGGRNEQIGTLHIRAAAGTTP